MPERVFWLFSAWLFLLFVELIQAQEFDTKVDDSSQNGKVDKHGNEIAPHDRGAPYFYFGILEVLSPAHKQSDQRIDDIGHESGHHFGHRAAQDETDREADDSLLANEIKKTEDVITHDVFWHTLFTRRL